MTASNLEKVFVDEQHVPQENEFDQFEDESTHIIGYDDNNLLSPLPLSFLP